MRTPGLLVLLVLFFAAALVPPASSAELLGVEERGGERARMGVGGRRKRGKKKKKKKKRSDRKGASKKGWKIEKKKAKKCSEDSDCLVNTGYCDEDACNNCRSSVKGSKKNKKKKTKKKGGKCKRGDEPRLCSSDPCTGLVPSCGPGGTCVLTDPAIDEKDILRLVGEASEGCKTDDDCKIDIGSCGEYACKCIPLLQDYDFTLEEQCPGGGCGCARCTNVCGGYIPKCNDGGTCDVGKPPPSALPEENACASVEDCRLKRVYCVTSDMPYKPCECVPLHADQESPDKLCSNDKTLDCTCADFCVAAMCDGLQYDLTCEKAEGESMGQCEVSKVDLVDPPYCEDASECRAHRVKCVQSGSAINPCECVVLSQSQIQGIPDCTEGDPLCECVECAEDDCDQYGVICNDTGLCELTKP